MTRVTIQPMTRLVVGDGEALTVRLSSVVEGNRDHRFVDPAALFDFLERNSLQLGWLADGEHDGPRVFEGPLKPKHIVGYLTTDLLGYQAKVAANYWAGREST